MASRTENITYRCLYGILKAVARLPFGVLYALSDLMSAFIYNVVRYRRRMVTENLRSCFPEKSETEIRAIRRQFYRNFADYVVETIKLLHVSDAEIKKRFTWSGLENITDEMNAGRSVVAYFSHCGNWEWAPSITLHCPGQLDNGDLFCQIYRPLRDPVFNRLMLKVRSRFGSVSIPKASALRKFIEMRRQDIVSVTGFMSDQKPSHGDPVHIIPFLGRPTKVITGTETLARRLGMAVVYWDITKPARGHYHVNVVRLTENAADTQPFELTDKYFSLLEKNIRQNPSIWLWTHNRWKHRLTADEIAEYDKTRQNNL